MAGYEGKGAFQQLMESAAIILDDSDSCWDWGKAKDADGYGVMSKNKVSWAEVGTTKAHRASYQVFKGEIPKGLCVCHTCDNPACVHPDHLFLGTQADNMTDKKHKKRQVKYHFTDEELADIRSYRGKRKMKEVLAKYGFGRTLLNLIWTEQGRFMRADKQNPVLERLETK
jgi:hypothetical protein